MDRSSLIRDALNHPADAVMYQLASSLARTYPDRYLLETEFWAFDVEEFAKEGLCKLHPHPHAFSQLDTDAKDHHYQEVALSAYNTWYELEWQGERFELIALGLMGPHCRNIRQFLLAPNRELADRLFLEVCRWNAEVRGEVLVYNDGWHKDAELFAAIQSSTLSNLVLEGDLKEQITGDFQSFFKARATYERYGIPWKRGVLLLGPPGNGKTHCIKALIHLLKVPALYVRSFQREYGTEISAIRQVFERARQTAPCILVLEDLDSLINDQNRSFFLNEMDGFAENSGLVVIGTSNHPERLDPAILERPSRFDRKYTFNLPDEACRLSYLMDFSGRLEPDLRLTLKDAAQLSRLTEDFSYVYLRELFLSGMMSWIHHPGRPFAEVLEQQVATLRMQMLTPPAEGEAGPVDGEEDLPHQALYRSYMRRWNRRG